jgi:hypothetical protein
VEFVVQAEAEMLLSEPLLELNGLFASRTVSNLSVPVTSLGSIYGVGFVFPISICIYPTYLPLSQTLPQIHHHLDTRASLFRHEIAYAASARDAKPHFDTGTGTGSAGVRASCSWVSYWGSWQWACLHACLTIPVRCPLILDHHSY